MMDDRQSALFLYEEAMGFTYAAALRAVAALGIADHLADGPRTAAELAAATGVDAEGLHRLLRLSATRGIFREDAAGRFHLTARGGALRTGSAAPARSGILMFTDEMFWRMSHNMAGILQDGGRGSFDRIFGMALSEYFDRSPGTTELFYDGMATVSEAEEPLVVGSYEFPSSGVVADIGGRHGSLLLEVLRRNPGLRGVLFDQEHEVPRHRLDVEDLAGRWDVVPGDFFAGVPAADVYLLKRILHNWDDERSVRILRNCRAALPPGGRVLVIDAVVPPGNGADQSKAMDFMMLAARTGKERTAAEFERLFGAAGLRLTRILPTPSVMSIAEGVA